MEQALTRVKLSQCSNKVLFHYISNTKYNNKEDEQTPLQLKLNILADKIGVFGFNCACLTFTCMTLHLIGERLYLGEVLFDISFFNHILEYFMIGVTVVVVAGI